MSIMKEIAHALGVNLNEEFKIKQDTGSSGRQYRFTEKGLLKSDDDGATWDTDSYLNFYALCVNDWKVEKVPPKPKEDPLLTEYIYISNMLAGFSRLKHDNPSIDLESSFDDAYRMEKIRNEAQYMINALDARKNVLRSLLQEKGFKFI